MVFSTLPFILIFMPVFFTGYYLVPQRFKNGFLLAGSLCFYVVGCFSYPLQMIVLFLSMAVDYAAGILMGKVPAKKRLIMIVSVVLQALCLLSFKYIPFTLSQISAAIPGFNFNADIVLPLGISFYTFQGITYVVDVYRGTVKPEKNVVCFAVYMMMFAQLIAGPIVTYDQVEEDLHCRKLDKAVIFHGLAIFIVGLGLKGLLANPVGKLWTDVNTIGFDSISTPLAWMAIFAFSFQLYFDFFGYSLMTIGLGEMLGFKLPENFNFPYTARTMTDFWRRWHMTLSGWFKNYVYIPLGGNRKGKLATVRNLLIVWVLTGIWHGAGYHFILWGFLLFFFITLEKFAIGKTLNRIPALGHIYMILLIPLTWAVFAIPDMGQIGLFFSRLFPFFGQGPWSIFCYDYLKYLQQYAPFLIAGVLFSTKLPFTLFQKIKLRPIKWGILVVILGCCLYCMYRGMNDPFLYFQF